ncbi:Protein Xrp2 [Tritrichomonas musculus]|uniref:Protein Xrp2 n=1 Tax=Tritrichomonas musculus TaxID=1915356 RepID=A0ABR2KTT5_9EUKA
MGQVISYIWPSTPETESNENQETKESQPHENETANTNPPQATTSTPSAPTKPQIDRSIFVQKDKKDETIIRTPGQINGNQFAADKLENCKVIVHDFCDSMMIDRCVNCEFVLSAVRGSIFARNCKNCKFAMVCGQFRCRECEECDFFMQVKTGPVVESSQNLRIGCALVSYNELAEQMKKARLDPATNIWNDVHDFTPGEGHFSLAGGEKLDMEILNNEGTPILPFTYIPSKVPGQSFNVKLDNKYWEKIVQLSFNDLKLEGTHRESDGNFSIDVSAESEDAAKAIFAEFSPISVSSI